jgi:hypothetical protein
MAVVSVIRFVAPALDPRDAGANAARGGRGRTLATWPWRKFVLQELQRVRVRA